MANPDFPQNREEMLLNAIAGSPYDVPVPVPQSRVEKWLAFLAENGIPGNVKIGGDVATVADLPAEGAVGEMHYVTAESLFYVYKIADGTGEWIPVGADFDPSEFARADGTYPEMKVGYSDVSEYSAYADQLDATVKTTVSSPFVFRPAGGGADVEGYLGSKATIAAVYGNTLVWNQRILNGNFQDTSAWSTQSVNITVSDNVMEIKKPRGYSAATGYVKQTTEIDYGHVFLWSVDIKSEDVGTNLYLFRSNKKSYNVVDTGWHTVTYFDASPVGSSDTILHNIWIYNDTADAERTVYVKNFVCFDLTKMFGAGNEPASVEAFRALFPLPYYAYDEGRLLNFTGTGIRTVGFNQWDEEWALGYYDAGGNPQSDTTRIRSKNYIKVFPGTAYYTNKGMYICFYDSNKKVIRRTETYNTFTTPNNAHYIRFNMFSSYGNVYKHDICINLSWSGYRNGEYVPYHAETKSIPVSTYFPNGMNSAGSARDELWNNKKITKVGIFDLGTADWKIGGEGMFYATVTSDARYAVKADVGCICVRYSYGGTVGQAPYYKDKQITLYYRGSGDATKEIYIKDTDYSDVADFKASLNGVLMYYELMPDRWTETPIDPPLDMTFNSSDFGTELLLPENGTEPTTTPMYAGIDYVQNLRDKLQRLPNGVTEGDYYVHSDGVNQEYRPLPTLPTADGVYTLKCTVASGTPEFAWVADAETQTGPDAGGETI